MSSVKYVLQALLDTVFPPSCLCCKRSGAALCANCLSAIPMLVGPLCSYCGTPIVPSKMCSNCAGTGMKLHGLRVVSLYQEPLRSYIHALKYEGRTGLAEPLGTLLASTYLRSHIHADLIIPVPLHTQRLRARGYNQAQLLAEVCARRVQVDWNYQVLARVRATSAQVSLSHQERLKNVSQAFRCVQPQIVHNRRVLLIDDVCTTGATLEACAVPLLQARAREVWGLVLARPMGKLLTGKAEAF
jgi:ComF family protein